MARTHGHGNPKWTRDEILLALDLYFQCGDRLPSPRDSRVVELSKLLQLLPAHDSAERKASFRNPDGGAFKLQNLRRLATGEGLQNFSIADEQVWKEFRLRQQDVHTIAGLIKNSLAAPSLTSIDVALADVDEFAEGAILTRLHKAKERNPQVRRYLLKARRHAGKLYCDVCFTPSNSLDPDLEDAAFEAHHVIPLSAAGQRNTRLTDMALLCANCHRLLHRAIALQRRWVSVEDAKKLVNVRRST